MAMQPEYCKKCAQTATNTEQDYDAVSVYFDAEDFVAGSQDHEKEVLARESETQTDPEYLPKCYFTLDSFENEQDVSIDGEIEKGNYGVRPDGSNLLHIDSSNVHDSRSSAGVFEKKVLSPIVERKMNAYIQSAQDLRSSTDDGESEEPEEVKTKRKIGLSGRNQPSCKERKATTETGRRSANPTPNIEKMIKDLFIYKTFNEQSFKAVDPLEVEKKTSHGSSKLWLSKRSESYETNFRGGSIKNLFSPVVQRFLSRDWKPGKQLRHSNDSLDRRRAYSDNTFSDSETNLRVEISSEELIDDCFEDDVDYERSVETHKKQRQKDFRRNSSPEAFPQEMKLMCLFKRNIKEKKDEKPERKKSTKEWKTKGDKSCRLSRENSVSSPWGSRKGTPKLSRESSLASPAGSKKGTHYLSRESSLASPVGSRMGTPKSSREGSYTSPHNSKRGTPKLSRDSSPSSPKCLRNETKMPKVTSMPQLESKRQTPKLERRKSTPKLKRQKDSSREHVRQKKMSDSELNRQKTPGVKLNRCTSTPELSRKRFVKSKSREKSFEVGQCSSTSKKPERRSKKETCMCEQDPRVMTERWLDQVLYFSVGTFSYCIESIFMLKFLKETSNKTGKTWPSCLTCFEFVHSLAVGDCSSYFCLCVCVTSVNRMAQGLPLCFQCNFKSFYITIYPFNF